MINNFFSWTTQNTYLFAGVKTVIDKKSVDEKRSRSHRREKVVDSIWSHVSIALNLKENGFLSIIIMVCPQQNEPHSLLKGNPDNIHEADSPEKHQHEKQIPASLFTFFY